MKIVVSCKVVPDDQDIRIAGDGSLDYSRAQQTVSTYDLNAIEAAARLAAIHDASVAVISAGPGAIDDSKLKKNILARGVDELYMTADDACTAMDARATSEALAALLEQVGAYDLVICGDGSADNYAHQVEVQLAVRLGVAVVTSVAKLSIDGDRLRAERLLEDVVEVVEVPLPAVVSVVPDVALPRIPGMKDIVSAGKKPMHIGLSESLSPNTVEVVSVLAPEQVQRKLEVLEADREGAIESFAAALKAAL